MNFGRLEAVFQGLIDQARLPGAVMQVRRHGEIVYEAALGERDPATHAPMTPDAIFRIYSMTKPVTSVAILMLIEEGQIGLDDPVTHIVPEFARLEVGITRSAASGPWLERVAARRIMTIRDLLRHTAGLTYGSFETSLVKDLYIAAGVESQSITNQSLIEKLALLPLAFEPGTVWEYSRATDVLGAIVERLAGVSLGTFFAERICAPLGMSDTGFQVPAAALPRLAEPFPTDPDSGAAVRLRDVGRTPTFESGGGGLVSTVEDYARFQEALLGMGASGGVRLLRPDSVALMTRDHLGDIARGSHYLPGPHYGFGLGVAVRLADGADGHAGDYYWGGLGGTFQWIDPTLGLGAILMIQAPNQRDEFRSLFRRLVYEGLAA